MRTELNSLCFDSCCVFDLVVFHGILGGVGLGLEHLYIERLIRALMSDSSVKSKFLQAVLI